MGLNNKGILFFFLLVVITLSACDGAPTPPNFLNTEWTSDEYDIVELGRVEVTGNEVTPPVTDDSITQLVLNIGEASQGQCRCSAGTLTSHICLNSEVPICNGDSCDCEKVAEHCPGGTSVPLTVSCTDPIYDPDRADGSGSLANNACCMPAATTPTTPPECVDDDDCSFSQVCNLGRCEAPTLEPPAPTCSASTRPSCSSYCQGELQIIQAPTCDNGNWVCSQVDSYTCQLGCSGGSCNTCSSGQEICTCDGSSACVPLGQCAAFCG